MSQAILNLINKETTKESVREAYRNYPTTTPKGGFEAFHASTVEPIFCEVPEGAKVLDVGCNDGELMRMLRDHKRCDVTGVDLSETALDLARGKGLNVLNVSAEELPFEDGTFDVVVMREVLVHIHEPVKALKEIKRVLRPEGFLLGSTPHANLERTVWDDKAPHHRYYDETRLTGDLDQAFEETHLKVLNGAQFAVSFAMSHLGDKPCEMLFKSGGKDLPAWEHALISDKETLRVWMGPTQMPGTAYYRMIGFAAKMRAMKGVEVGFEEFSWTDNNSCSEWQRKILDNGEGQPISSMSLAHLDKCLKVSNPWIFQVTYYEDVISLFECAKEAYPHKKLITETDDWMFDLPAYNVASNAYKPGNEKEKIAMRQLELSDAIVTSTNYLKEGYSNIFPDKPIYVIPNSIDFNIWDNTKGDGKMDAKGEGVVRIGFTGCGNHGGDLEIVKPVLMALLEEFPNLELILTKMHPKHDPFGGVKHPRIKIDERFVSIADYPAMVKGWDLDIGIAPLRDNAFNRAKSNLRWLEYSAMKIPTVASNVRPFTEAIEDGVDGYLSKDKNDWYSHLASLISHPARRKAIGKLAYDRVKKDFNMDTVAQEYSRVLKEIRDGR